MCSFKCPRLTLFAVWFLLSTTTVGAQINQAQCESCLDQIATVVVPVGFLNLLPVEPYDAVQAKVGCEEDIDCVENINCLFGAGLLENEDFALINFDQIACINGGLFFDDNDDNVNDLVFANGDNGDNKGLNVVGAVVGVLVVVVLGLFLFLWKRKSSMNPGTSRSRSPPLNGVMSMQSHTSNNWKSSSGRLQWLLRNTRESMIPKSPERSEFQSGPPTKMQAPHNNTMMTKPGFGGPSQQEPHPPANAKRSKLKYATKAKQIKKNSQMTEWENYKSGFKTGKGDQNFRNFDV
eukprot:CAMPEP_0204865026 /NCGR_PEP_ID=MMETSP1348-20121228/4523_1 /ASSEMBLY_ACC=CAM_ASM_000700 /TAXON_ID=215587 /ORGANISM="Aplanochytrium stocchinoi, Strain GSBS06" /LENGTH=292 /DNA_ID=CAMNT_0052015897 /DNA_START=46 /DNA_END=924 /DNA_ORIENTATION=+